MHLHLHQVTIVGLVVVSLAPNFARANWLTNVETGLRRVFTPDSTRDHVEALASGRLVYRDEPIHDTLDDKTILDLEMNSLVIPQITSYAPSGLGKARLRYLLTHPYLDSEYIRQRQDAVAHLVSHPELRQALGKIFNKIAETYGEGITSRYVQTNVTEANGGRLIGKVDLAQLGALAATIATQDMYIALVYAQIGLYGMLPAGELRRRLTGALHDAFQGAKRSYALLSQERRPAGAAGAARTFSNISYQNLTI